jgi:hypothetical protein
MATKSPIAVKQVRGEHEFALSDSFSDAKKVITQTAYYKGDGFVLALGELNLRNHWNDPKFDAICKAVEAACNALPAVSHD